MTHFADLPSSFRLGPYDVQISVRPAPWSDAQVSFGMFSTNPAGIEIAEDIACPITAAVTLRHEINHAIYHVYCLGKEGGDIEERVVDGMAHAWTQIERDNPGLTAWFAAALLK